MTNTPAKKRARTRGGTAASALLGAFVLLLAMPALATEPKTFATPEEAAQALLDVAESEDMNAMSGVLGDEFRDELENEDAAQAALAKLSRQGKQIIATNSGHHIQIEDPEIVVKAIRDVVTAARR